MTYVAQHLPGALRACACDLEDPDLFEYLMMEMAGAYGRQHRWIPLARDHHALPASTVADLAPSRVR